MIRPVRVVTIADNDGLGPLMDVAIKTREDLAYVASVNRLDQAVKAVQTYGPDIVVLDWTLHQSDAFSVLAQMKHLPHKPKVLALTGCDDDRLMQRGTELGVDYFLMKPVDGDTLGKRMRQIASPEHARLLLAEERRRRLIEKYAARHLTHIGMPSHFKGFRYSVEAIVMVSFNPPLINAVTTKLYPAIASKYDSLAAQVERAIRHAIETTWTRGNLDAIDGLFAYSVDAFRGKPTNASFIARLSDQVRHDLLAG